MRDMSDIMQTQNFGAQSGHLFTTLSEGLAHSTVHDHLKQLSVDLQLGALILISELLGVI